MVIRASKWSAPFAISAAMVASLLLASMLPARADQTVPLEFFEKQVDASVSLRAAGALVDEDEAALQGARDRAGLEEYFSNGIGPHHEIVTNRSSRSFFRYAQELGVRIPIFGANELQQQAIVMASAERTLGGLAVDSTRLGLLGKVRQNYITYWSARQQEAVAQKYIDELGSDASSVQSLRRNGFWTSADELRYTDLIEKARIDLSRARLDQQNALAQLTSVTNIPMAPFVPVEPSFGSCPTSAVDALPSAVRQDAELAKLAALTDEAQALSRLQRWPGINASVGVGVLTSADAPGGVGYALVIGLNFEKPTHEDRIQADETRRIAAQLREYELLAQQRRADLAAAIGVAVANRSQAIAELEQDRRNVVALGEDLRESRIRLKSIAPNTLSEAQGKSEPAYRARLAVVQAEAALLMRVNELLQLAPSAC